MTSEVLMLNKDAVVIAADSAVTTGRDPHPRYSKAANKIFDLSLHGNVAVTIYAAADIDSVPWELALKQFRQQDTGNAQRPTLREYVDALIAYLQGNTSLFPATVQAKLLQRHFFQAALDVIRRVETLCPDFADVTQASGERMNAWAKGHAAIAAQLAAMSYEVSLGPAEYQNIVAQGAALQADLAPLVASEPKYVHADVAQLTQLAIETLVKRPREFMSYTGLVFAGYGADEIFPSFFEIHIYGRVGATILWADANSFAITHDNDAWIQSFAQSTMIDRFTDGFDGTLRRIIHDESLNYFNAIIADMNAAGIPSSAAVTDPIVAKRHTEFTEKWVKKNWDVNFHPLRRVLNSLSVSEMGHLAESLLVLEELRERVTSPSESVGGPIDVVVITKTEGLLWLKRKHFFDPSLNMRYLNRTKSHYT